MRLLFILVLLLLFSACTSTEEKIKTELERECNCSKVEITESQGAEIPYITYHLIESKHKELVKESGRIFLILIERVKGFCDLNKKVVIRFEDKNGKEQTSSVYYNCQLQFEF